MLDQFTDEGGEFSSSTIVSRSPEIVELSEAAISWRYNIDLYQVKQWLRQTEWNNSEAKGLEAEHREVVAYLLNLELISENEAKDWKEKLFT